MRKPAQVVVGLRKLTQVSLNLYNLAQVSVNFLRFAQVSVNWGKLVQVSVNLREENITLVLVRVRREARLGFSQGKILSWFWLGLGAKRG